MSYASLILFEEADEVSHYEVVHNKTGHILGKYKNRNRARGVADKKDLEYGAIAHQIKTKIDASTAKR
jgi:hypothetical protein